MIYHLVTEKEYLQSIGDQSYAPASLGRDGFVHCALEVSVTAVANDYYANVADRLLLLQIVPEKLKAQTKYETAKPGAGAGTAHKTTSPVFPHVFGPIDNCAVSGVGVLRKGEAGYVWPQEFAPLGDYLRGKTRAATPPK